MLPSVDHQKLLRFVTRYVGPQDAEDVVQQTYLRVLTTEVVYDPRKSAYQTWVQTIAKSLAIDHLRNLDPAVTLEGRRVEGLAPSALAFDVERVVTSLPGVEADAWRTYETHGDGPAAALACGVSLRTFRRRYYRALARIREVLA